MTVQLACIAGEEMYRQWDTGQVRGESLGRRTTPFGESGDLFRIQGSKASFYLLARHGEGMNRTAPHRVNSRANLYALKDMGVDCVLGWGPGGAITHNIAVGDLVILNDIIDQTCQRAQTFFPDSPLGILRQFPVFCEELRRRTAMVLQAMKLIHHPAGLAVVREGPRLETPAEVRMLSAMGAEIVTHTFVPEMFLARELQMGYAAVCYVTSYAETGSRYVPFARGGLFKDIGYESEVDRLSGIVGALNRLAADLADSLTELDAATYGPARSQAHHIEQFHLPGDWRGWFGNP